MRLTSLTLHNVRNYASLQLDLGESMRHLFVGLNGAGKTNILEAISYLSLSRSCRGAENAEVAMWDANDLRIRGDALCDDGSSINLECVCTLSPRQVKALFINDVRRQAADFVGTLPSTVFLPQDMPLLTGAPAERRRFLDQLLCQVSPEYLQALSQYQKMLGQRNTLLRRIVDGDQPREMLQLWNEQIAPFAAKITILRLELFETLNLTFEQELQALKQPWEQSSLRYQRKTTEREERVLVQEFLELFDQYVERDLAMKSTSVGPHRDDWVVMVNDKPLGAVASRGQQRLVLLSILLLVVSFLELKRGEKPIILLDDAFSELDSPHQDILIDTLRDYQVFLTAAHLPGNTSSLAVWQVDNGTVERVRS